MICVQGFHLTSPRKQASDLPREPLQGRPLLSRESSQLYGPCTTPRQECELVVSGPVLYCNNPLSLTLHSWIKKKWACIKYTLFYTSSRKIALLAAVQLIGA